MLGLPNLSRSFTTHQPPDLFMFLHNTMFNTMPAWPTLLLHRRSVPALHGLSEAMLLQPGLWRGFAEVRAHWPHTGCTACDHMHKCGEKVQATADTWP